MAAENQITEMLRLWGSGDEQAAERLVPIVYAELRQIAHRHMRRERPGRTLQTTALVHEAYVRLLEVDKPNWHSRGHFFAFASRVMRRVLVDAARARLTAKRGGLLQRVSLDDGLGLGSERPVDLIALDDALQALAGGHPRKAQVVEMRFFGGLDAKDVARYLDISPDSVTRDWNFARSWLRRELVKA